MSRAALAVALALLGLLPGRAHAEPVADFIASYAKDHNFNGTIVIQRAGKPEYAHSFGLASFQLKVPNSAQTKYKIASITKAFTSVLILQLVDAGKLDLKQTIKHYLPRYAGPAGDKVSIHQLLNHTSGLENIDRALTSVTAAVTNGMPVYQAPYTSDQLVAKFCSGPLVHEPGTTFDYNNADYMVLGKIIEAIYGKPYDQVLHEHILDPLKLTSTGLLTQPAIIDNLAETYFMRDDLKVLANDFPVYPENWYAAGSMYSTPTDLLAFATALFGGKLLKPATLDLMITPGLEDYGYGVWSFDTKIDGRTYHVVKRPGRIMGAQGELFHIMAPDLTIVMLSNTGTTDLDELAAEIAKRAVRGRS